MSAARLQSALAHGGVRDLTTGCLIWTKGRNSGGYGSLWYKGKSCLVHRLAWESANGRSIPPGQVIAHVCHRPLCFEPSHLRLSSQRQNMVGSLLAGRHSAAKLTAAQAAAIRTMKGEISAKALAVTYGVHPRTIHLIWANKTWKDV